MEPNKETRPKHEGSEPVEGNTINGAAEIRTVAYFTIRVTDTTYTVDQVRHMIECGDADLDYDSVVLWGEDFREIGDVKWEDHDGYITDGVEFLKEAK